MRSGFNWDSLNLKGVHRGVRFWLQTAVGILAISNAVALFLYLDPPGGSRAELGSQSQRLQFSISAAKAQALRLKRVSTQVQLGGQQAADFQSRYIFPKRFAYESIMAEIQRMAQVSNLTERDGQWTEEPIEGTADLSLLTNAVNFEGSYESLMRFLYAVDRSPQLLMLDTLTATPQKGGQVTAQVRFQAVIREEQSPQAGGQP
jgi:Tfp pilus assembly protein PilO